MTSCKPTLWYGNELNCLIISTISRLLLRTSSRSHSLLWKQIKTFNTQNWHRFNSFTASNKITVLFLFSFPLIDIILRKIHRSSKQTFITVPIMRIKLNFHVNITCKNSNTKFGKTKAERNSSFISIESINR